MNTVQSTVQSYAEWMSSGRLSPYVRALHVAGDVMLMEAAQPAGDMSDPPTCDLTVFTALAPVRVGRADFGAGRWSKRFDPDMFSGVAPQVATDIMVDEPHAIRVIAFNGDRFRAPLAELRPNRDPFDFGALHGEGLRAPRLSRLIEAMWQEALHGDAASRLYLEGAALAFLAQLARLADAAAEEGPRGLLGWQQRRCTEYLRDHLAENVTIEELARLVRLSPFHFARLFKASTGLPPAAYQRRLRCQRAQEMLRSSDFEIGQIAFSVGYETPQAFARMFRAETGTSPTEWRRRARA